MGYYCTVPQCTSLAGKTKNVKFHRFPRDVTMADKWNDILKRGKPYTKYSKVCSLHFTQADYNVTTMGQWKTLSKDAVPSQNLPKLNPDGTVMVIRKSRTIKYKECKKEDLSGDKDKWASSAIHSHISATTESAVLNTDAQDNLAYRLQTLHSIANTISPHTPIQNPHAKPKKQDAFMQTDPVQSEEDDTQPNNSYSESSEKYTTDIADYDYHKQYDQKKFQAKDYTKPNDDYIPQTNEEYNKEAEKYALGRKSHNGFDKPMSNYQKTDNNGYKMPDVYSFETKDYQNGYVYQNGYSDSVELLRNQQHNLQMLQEQHRITENQNFLHENHIKQEVDLKEDKYIYERSKEQLDAHSMYSGERRSIEQRVILEHIQQQVKQEPEANTGCENVMQPQTSPYYTNGQTNVAAGYYEQLSRPGPELLIAKQNALAAHTQLWQNMKRPLFYNEPSHYNASPILHRYEDVTRVIQ